jgi:excisionase family DNA binding protein
MKTYSLQETAKLLHMHPETVRQLATSGRLPASKPGKRWVFLEDDILQYIRSRQTARATVTGGKLCRYDAAVTPGTSTSKTQVDPEYAELLGLQTAALPKSCTTG